MDMDWVRIALAALLTTAIPVAAFDFFHRRQKRRENQDSDFAASEKQRALKIASDFGHIMIHLIQAVAGIAAAIPVFAIGVVIITPPNTLPALETVLTFIGMFVFGWIVFAWSMRITDSLRE